MQSCCSPIASASAAAPRLRPLQLLLPTQLHRSVSTAAAALSSRLASASAAARRLRPLQLHAAFNCQLLPDCVCFGCCSPMVSASTLPPDVVRFVCCSPIATASAAAPRLRPLRLLLPASCSGRFHPCPLFSNILRRVRGSQ